MQASQVVNGPHITWLVRRLHLKRSGMLDRFWTRSIIEATSWISLIGWFEFKLIQSPSAGENRYILYVMYRQVYLHEIEYIKNQSDELQQRINRENINEGYMVGM